MSISKLLFTGLLFLITAINVFPQPIDSARIASMTREEITALSQDDLLELSMENLVFLAGKMGISIDELLNLKTSVASKSVLTPRETPGIVSIITKEEIRNSGARDLIDVLRLVPGFDFGYDVQGVIGAGLRGNWVHEGKILMMIDGQPLNDLSYANLPFGNHIAVDQIKRIEIIRGPGSAIYGGTAELGVVNIITLSGKDLQGGEVSYTYGQMQHSMGRENTNINTGFIVKNWDISAHHFNGRANRSDQPFIEYIDDHDNVIDLSEGNSDISTRQLNLAATNDKLSLRLVYDNYSTRYNYYEDSLTGNVSPNNEFRHVLGEVKYNIEVNDKLSFIPRLNYKFSRPYYEEDYWRNFQANRYAGTLMINYQPGKRLSLVSGVEYYNDNGRCVEDSGYFYYNGTRNISINNISVFAEGMIKIKHINLVAGFRAEHNSIYGWSSAPRIGLTGIFNKFHFKTLVSGSFRTPGIGNIDVASDLKPEESWVTELEVGYRLNDHMFITANVFDIFINKSITYFDNGGWTPGVDWGYTNADNAGSSGFELEYKAIYSKGYLTMNYAYYTQAFRSIPELYGVPEEENHALGLSTRKVGIYGNYRPAEGFSISPSFIYLGKKYGYTDVDDEENPVITGFGPDYLVNLSIAWENVLTKGLNVSLSVFDLLNEKPPFIQPYNGWFYPYPGRSRELILKVTLNTSILKEL